MNWDLPIDIYCERTSPTLLAEPVNLLTNTAFYISAYFGYLLVRKTNQSDSDKRELFILVILIFFIGTGSSLFHSFAKPWAEILDIIPIGLFIVYYWYCMQKKLFHQTNVHAVGCVFVTSLFASAIIILLPPLPILKAYLLPLGVLLGLGITFLKKYGDFLILKITALFALSLTFRSIDEPLCQYLPLGTHFLWHLCNALILYMCTYALVKMKTKN